MTRPRQTRKWKCSMYTWEKGSWKWMSLYLLNPVIFIFYQLKLIKMAVSCGLTQYMAIFPFFNQENSFSMINTKKKLTEWKDTRRKTRNRAEKIYQLIKNNDLVLDICYLLFLIHASLCSNLLGTHGRWPLRTSQQLSLAPSRWLASGLVGVLTGGRRAGEGYVQDICSPAFSQPGCWYAVFLH